MDDPPRGGMTPALFLAAGAGPATAFLYESGLVPLGPTASLWPYAVIVLAAVVGIFLGLKIRHRGMRRLHWLAVLLNGLVLCFYGFFLLFFGLGGSR